MGLKAQSLEGIPHAVKVHAADVVEHILTPGLRQKTGYFHALDISPPCYPFQFLVIQLAVCEFLVCHDKSLLCEILCSFLFVLYTLEIEKCYMVFEKTFKERDIHEYFQLAVPLTG